MNRRFTQLITGIYFVILSAGCQNVVTQSHLSPPAGDSESKLSAIRLSDGYRAILARITTFNRGSPPMDGWWMTTEHLFVYDVRLQSDVVEFVAQPPNDRMLLGRLTAPQINPNEVLAIVQLLVYFNTSSAITGPLHCDGVVADLEASLANGHFAEAERKYPNAQINRIVREACFKARTGRFKLFSDRRMLGRTRDRESKTYVLT